MPDKDFWKNHSFSDDDLLSPGFPELPMKREDMTDDTADRLNRFYADRQEADEATAREDRAENWLSRFLAIWNR